ncbi:zinc finger protein 2 homolog isoform X6 [Acanthopagrus latus]|uniref:zinc finger protein 2 homolog isoform X6 n=1 Tax=Acanthopagrus latus TaxID=8177 RepID=UPI00187D0657|nr:zinc finger protein 2 homolog isoform X6 [Acanthopagrus latus]
MSSVECLRGFISERLTAAAEEIFGVFQKTIVKYEEEIDRQRKLLDIFWKPEIKLHRIELPQQRVCTEDEVLTDQLLCNQERNSSLDQEEPEPPQIKEEQEELCSSQEGEQLVLKQETDTAMLISPYEDSDHSGPEPNSDHQLLPHNSHVAESQNQEGGKHGDSGSTRAAEPEAKKRPWKSHSDAHTAQKGFKCGTCGSVFKYKSQFVMHQRVHTGEKPFACDTCGTRFTQRSALNCHIRLHTGEKPFSCQFCGKAFRRSSNLSVHMRNHTDDKPYPCDICGIQFDKGNLLKAHMRVHREVVQ